MTDHQQLYDYAHREPDQKVTAIGGHYVFTKEGIITFGEREVLYRSGYALLDTTCCGFGGWSYALVQGFVEKWQYRTDADGIWQTQLSPVCDASARKKIGQRIQEKETVQQVGFYILP